MEKWNSRSFCVVWRCFNRKVQRLRKTWKKVAARRLRQSLSREPDAGRRNFSIVHRPSDRSTAARRPDHSAWGRDRHSFRPAGASKIGMLPAQNCPRFLNVVSFSSVVENRAVSVALTGYYSGLERYSLHFLNLLNCCDRNNSGSTRVKEPPSCRPASHIVNLKRRKSAITIFQHQSRVF